MPNGLRYTLPAEQGSMQLTQPLAATPEERRATPASVGLMARIDEEARERREFAVAEREKSGLGLIPASSPELKANRRQHLIRQAARHGVPQNVLANQIAIEGIEEAAPAPPPKAQPAPKTLEAALARQVFDKKISFEDAQKQLTAGKGKGAGKEFETAAKLRKEFTGSAKDFVKTRDSFARVQASVQDPSAAGDMALIFNYMKILDPGSTVREGEFATAQNAAGLPERIKAQYNKVLTGERLGDIQRQDFVGRAGKLFSKQSTQHKKRVSEYTRLAKRFDLSPEDIIVDLTDPETLAEAGMTEEEGAAAVEDIVAAAKGTPTIGSVESGYRFKGGNPADKNSWEAV